MSQVNILTLTNLPKASEDAIDFLDHISLEMLNPIAGEDELKYFSVTDADHNEVGNFNFHLQITNRGNKPVLKVTFNVKYTVNGIKRNTNIISNFTLQAKLIEQHYEKHIKAKYHLLRELNVVLQDEGAVFSQSHFIDGISRMKVQVTCRKTDLMLIVIKTAELPNSEACKGCETLGVIRDKVQLSTKSEIPNLSKHYMIPNQHIGGYIPSAFNVLLLKLFARMGGTPKPHMAFIGMDTDYNICEITYTTLPKTKLSVDDVWVEAVTIERKIHGINGEETTVNLLDESGDLLMIIRVGEGLYVIKPGVKHTKYAMKKFLDYNKKRKAFDWEKDLEMISQFEYMKERNKGELLKYQYNSPYWKCIIADFLQQLLVDKPSDALAYTAKYFLDFSSGITEKIKLN